MSRFWRHCRVTFRWCRIAVWLVVLAGLAFVLWCNRVGLPGFLKTRLVAALHERGVNLEFSRLRLDFLHGIVAEHVHAQAGPGAADATLGASEVQLQFNLPALLRRRWQLDGLILRDGYGSLPVSPTNALTLTNLQTQFRLADGDLWQLEQCRADFAGMQIEIRGAVRHAPEAARWPFFHAGVTNRENAGLRLKKFSDALQQIQLTGQPRLQLTLAGDARDLASMSAEIQAQAGGADTPWFHAGEFLAEARLTAATGHSPASWLASNLPPFRLTWDLRLDEWRSPKLTLCDAACSGDTQDATLTNVTVALQAGELTGERAGARWTATHFAADFRLAALEKSEPLPGVWSNLPPLRVAWTARLDELNSDQLTLRDFASSGDTQDGSCTNVWLKIQAGGGAGRGWSAKDFAADLRLAASAKNVAEAVPLPEPWSKLPPGRLAWTARLGTLRSDKLNAEAIDGAGEWRAPELTVTRLTARIGGGSFHAGAALDVAARQLTFTNQSRFDLHAVAALLTEKTRGRLAEIAWTQPPDLWAEGSLRLPPWTNLATVNWRREVEPTVRLRGGIAFTNAVALGAALDWLQTHFSYTDMVWLLPDLTLAQGRTRLAANGEESEITKDFHYQITGQLDAASVAPFLTTSNAVRGFGHLAAAEPLALDLQVRGNLLALETLAATGRVALTNFAVREQTVDSVAANVAYTNLVLQFLQPELWRAHGAQHMTADAIVMDFNVLQIQFVNGFSTAEPAALTRAIGPKTAKMMEPYQFLQPPTARIHGQMPLRNMNGPADTEGVDMTFDIGETMPFQWLKLTTPALKGVIHWLGPELILTNLQAELYGGRGAGSAFFDFRPEHSGADYHFDLAVTNVNIHAFAAAMASPTNHLEGSLSGWLAVTRADTRALESWNGLGQVTVRDGLLWDIPMFGLLSPVLNAVSPGLGNSRATEAVANYVITNGVIHTDSLEIRSTMMRLNYTGTVDMEQNVDARVTASLLQDLWVVGPLVSKVLWPVSKIFEFKVTGKLNRPQSTPVYIPKLFLAPLHPIRSLEELFTLPPPGYEPPSLSSPAGKN